MSDLLQQFLDRVGLCLSSRTSCPRLRLRSGLWDHAVQLRDPSLSRPGRPSEQAIYLVRPYEPNAPELIETLNAAGWHVAVAGHRTYDPKAVDVLCSPYRDVQGFVETL